MQIRAERFKWIKMPPYGREKYFFEYKKYFIASKPPFHGHFQCHMQKNTAKKRVCIDTLSAMYPFFPLGLKQQERRGKWRPIATINPTCGSIKIGAEQKT